jgi:hypothetical protein
MSATPTPVVLKVLGIAAPLPGVDYYMKGDRVEIVIDAGDGTRTYQVEATRAGRRVEISTGRGMVTVAEVTRGGTPVRTAQFMANRVLALVEHPADRHAPDRPQAVELPRPA